MKAGQRDQLNLIGFNILKSYYLESKDMVKFKEDTSRFNQLFEKIKPVKKLMESPNSYCETDASDSSFLSFNQQQSQSNQFGFDIKQVLALQDTRTTVMMKNIPNKFQTDNIVEVLNEKCKGKFDLVYLPIDRKLKKNYGYAFINFTHFIHIIHFYNEFNGRNWAGTNSKKICEIAYSKVQGRETILNHYPHKGMYISGRSKQSPMGS